MGFFMVVFRKDIIELLNFGKRRPRGLTRILSLFIFEFQWPYVEDDLDVRMGVTGLLDLFPNDFSLFRL